MVRDAESTHVTARLKVLVSRLQNFDSVGAKFIIRPHRKDETFYRRFIKNCVELLESLLVCQEVGLLLQEGGEEEGTVITEAPYMPQALRDVAAVMNTSKLTAIIQFLEATIDTSVQTNNVTQLLQVILPGRNTFLDATRAKYAQLLDDVSHDSRYHAAHILCRERPRPLQWS